jgi:hypothetical protein
VLISSPVGSAACSPSTLWRVTPYLTARMPPALVPTLPPTLALSSPGKTVYTNRAAAVAASRSASVTPGCTTATWLSASISRIWFIRSNEMSRPFGQGRAAADRPVPEPRAVTGICARVAAANIAATCSAVCGRATKRGATGSPTSASSW